MDVMNRRPGRAPASERTDLTIDDASDLVLAIA